MVTISALDINYWLDTFGRKRKLNVNKESAMADVTESEKRAIRRFALQLPVTVNAVSESGEVMQAVAETRDVSSHGVCFYCDAAMELGAAIQFTVTLPTEVTMTEPISVQCSGTVVRVEKKDGDSKFAIAAAIAGYEFVADEEEQNLAAGDDAAATL